MRPVELAAERQAMNDVESPASAAQAEPGHRRFMRASTARNEVSRFTVSQLQSLANSHRSPPAARESESTWTGSAGTVAALCTPSRSTCPTTTLAQPRHARTPSHSPPPTPSLAHVRPSRVSQIPRSPDLQLPTHWSSSDSQRRGLDSCSMLPFTAGHPPVPAPRAEPTSWP